MKMMVQICALAAVTLLFCGRAAADKKSDLYDKGVASVNVGDAIAARDAFCALADSDRGYKDADTQCRTYKDLAYRLLSRYKVNFAAGMSYLEAQDFQSAEMKFRQVEGGDYAEQAKQRLAEIQQLKMKAQMEAESRAAAARNAASAAPSRNYDQRGYDQVLHIGDSGTSFASLCSQNVGFETARSAETENPVAYFCAGWIKGAAQEAFGGEGKTLGGSCPPVDLTIGQETQLLMRYIGEHPESRESAPHHC